MRLRKPCEHGRYEAHLLYSAASGWPDVTCPGGEFLPDDALVIEKVDGEWPEWFVEELRHSFGSGTDTVRASLDALTVREGAG